MKVNDIKNLIFSRLSLNEKLDIKNNGRPTPELKIVQEQRECNNKNAFKRKFDKNIYNKTVWICGCEERNSFFCFVCLLFGGDDNWTKNGVNDLKHISSKMKHHENSAKHRDNFVSFQLLGKTDIATSISRSYEDEIRKHNETAAKNRQVLSKIIDILKLCGTCNLTLRGHNEENDSLSRGAFLELVDFLANVDCAFNSHIQEATVFKCTSQTIQHEILQCMLDVCGEHILEEIQKSSYLAVMVHDTTDVSTETPTVTVLRYELNGKVFERFWGFANPDRQDANGLSKCILKQISPILKDCPEKLIGQTYDGVAGMRGRLEDVNVKIQDKYKNAHFVYCYAHQLDKILEQVVSSLTSVRLFFANLKVISTFFSQSPDRMAALEHICRKRLPVASQTTLWYFHSRFVQSVNNRDIVKCLEHIVSGTPTKYTLETMTQAAGCIQWLEDDIFLYWFNFFSRVIPNVDVLFNRLQTVETHAVSVQIENFEKSIEHIRDNLRPRANDSRKHRRLNVENIDVTAREVCNIIIAEVRNRFSFKNHLCGAALFLNEKYEHYKRRLPLKDILTFCEAYPMVDKELLKTELGVFYSRHEITGQRSEDTNEIKSGSGCLQTLNFITSFCLDTAFKEIVKALKILVTIPMITSEAERRFSTLKLIKSFLRNTVDKDRLTALAMLSIEKSMVREIPNFNEKVIEKFISDKNRRMAFHYKKLSCKLKTAAPQPQRQRALPTSTIDSSGRPECLLKSATSQSQPLPTSTVVLIGIPGCSQPSTSSSGPPSVETFIKDEPSCSQEEVLDTAPTFELLPEQTEQPLSMATRSKPYTGSSDKVYCRLCLKPAHQTSLTPLSPVDFHHPEKDEALKKKKLEEIEEVNKMLKFCFPFYDSLTFGPVICSSCLARLKLCYEFSTECLKSQQLVEKYADKYCTTERLINLDEMIEKMSDDEKAVPDIPNVSSSRVSRKKRHSNEDSSPAKKQRVDHETQEEDYSSDSSDEETSIIKFEPDDDDSCTLSERLKKETDDDDSCALSKRLKKEPDDDDDAFTEDLPHDTRQSYVIDPNKFDEEIKVESMYIDHPDYIKDEPVDDLFIDNREFNERTNIGIDIRKQQPHFHETKNVPAPVSGQVFSNVGSSLGDSTSDVIK